MLSVERLTKCRVRSGSQSSGSGGGAAATALAGSSVSNPSAMLLDTGEALKVETLSGAELKKRGVNVNTSMCEHFPYTRQQLFHLVRIGELKTFEDLLARHGALPPGAQPTSAQAATTDTL